ncbi:hypothetical protein Tco_1152888 [Tanacetum coccineum]
MTTLAEYMILSGADNRPPMLDKDLETSQADCERLKAIYIILQGTSLTKQEIKCKLYDAFDKFAHIKGESLHQYYLRFTQQINDMNIYNIKLEQFQVNTKFLNSLPPEWSKFVTDVKLVKDLHTTNFDQLYAYLEQHEIHANEFRLMREHNQDPLALVSHQYGSTQPTQHSSTTYPSTPHAITYPSAPYPHAYSSTVHQKACPQPQSVPQIEYTVSTINQQTHLAEFPQIDSSLAVLLRNSSNPRQPTTIHDGRVTIQPLQGRQNSYATSTSGTGGNYSGKKFYWSKLKEMVKFSLRKNWNSWQILVLVTQSVITHNAAYQAYDLDAYDSDCDEIFTAKAVLMANLSSYGSNVLSERMRYIVIVISFRTLSIESQTAAVQDTNSSAQQDALILYVFEQLSNQVTNCNKVNNNNIIANETLSAELERYKERVKLLEERQNVDLGTREKLIIEDIIQEKNAQFADFEKEINNLKQTLSEQSKEKRMKAQQIRLMLYDGNVNAKETNVISIANSEETLMLEEESRSKMILKQSDPMVLEKKVNTKLIDYAELNRLSEDFGKRFVPQRELSDEQALHPIIDQSASSPVKRRRSSKCV